MDRRIREFYVIEKAALILYAVGAVGTIVFAAQGEWLRAGVTVAAVTSLWVAAMIRATRAQERLDRERALANYEREIAERSHVRRRREMQRRRNHR